MLPLSCARPAPAPPFRGRCVSGPAGAGPWVRPGSRARRRAFRRTDVEHKTSPPGRRGRGQDDDPHGAGSAEALLDSMRKLLLVGVADEEEEEEQGGFPKRWAIVFLCFSAFLLCNMDRVRPPPGSCSALQSLFSITCLHDRSPPSTYDIV
jgi:MFS transporter, ACS family, solute carrier family 17 (sodium-dependent inorganic phosphate cotransporter), other